MMKFTTRRRSARPSSIYQRTRFRAGPGRWTTHPRARRGRFAPSHRRPHVERVGDPAGRWQPAPEELGRSAGARGGRSAAASAPEAASGGAAGVERRCVGRDEGVAGGHLAGAVRAGASPKSRRESTKPRRSRRPGGWSRRRGGDSPCRCTCHRHAVAGGWHAAVRGKQLGTIAVRQSKSMQSVEPSRSIETWPSPQACRECPGAGAGYRAERRGVVPASRHGDGARVGASRAGDRPLQPCLVRGAVVVLSSSPQVALVFSGRRAALAESPRQAGAGTPPSAWHTPSGAARYAGVTGGR